MSDGLAKAEISFVENLRRIVVIVDVDESAAAPVFRPSVDDLLRWLDEYSETFLQANQRWFGGRLQSLHQRQLTLAGPGVLAASHDVLRVGRHLRGMGLTFGLSVPVAAMTRHPLVLPLLRSELSNLFVQIECPSAEGPGQDTGSAAEWQALAAHADSGGSLNLVTSVAEVRGAGLAERESFNRLGFSIARPTSSGTRPVHRLHRVAPCSDYMGWYVDTAGDVFPCAGMAGHAPACLGNLRKPFADVLHALAATRDAMVALAERGPASLEAPATSPFDLCALHRDAVTSLAAL